MLRKGFYLAMLLVPVLAALGIPANMFGQTDQDESSQIRNGDQSIEAGESVGDIVVIGGDLRVFGEITGDAAVLGGDLIVEDGGSILGDAFVTGGELRLDGGEVRGEMRTIEGGDNDVAQEILGAMDGIDRDVVVDRDDRDSERRIVIEAGRDRDRDHPLRTGFAGLVSALALALVLAGIGAVLVFYGRPYLETVSDTVRGATIRSAATGVAASFLVLPAFVVLIVALAVSIVGIPMLIAAIPLYPLAVFAAAVFGLLAVSHAIGERTIEQGHQPFDFRYRNSYAYMFSGLAMLILPLVAASLFHMTGFLGFIGTLLHVVTIVAIWACATTGFGAVILSRGGTRRTFVPSPPESGFDGDDLFSEGARKGVDNE